MSHDLYIVHVTQWEAKSPVPSVPFKNLVKQIVKLHDNLVDILPSDLLQVRRTLHVPRIYVANLHIHVQSVRTVKL